MLYFSITSDYVLLCCFQFEYLGIYIKNYEEGRDVTSHTESSTPYRFYLEEVTMLYKHGLIKDHSRKYEVEEGRKRGENHGMLEKLKRCKYDLDLIGIH